MAAVTLYYNQSIIYESSSTFAVFISDELLFHIIGVVSK